MRVREDRERHRARSLPIMMHVLRYICFLIAFIAHKASVKEYKRQTEAEIISERNVHNLISFLVSYCEYKPMPFTCITNI